MHDPDDDFKLNPIALDIMAWSRVADLRADCDEITKLYAALDDHERERFCVLLLGPEGFNHRLSAVSKSL